MPDDSDDKKVKEMLDAATRADLERWFGLPSFEQLAERGTVPQPAPPAEDPEVEAIRKRRDAAIAAIDPRWLEAHRLRIEPELDLLGERPPIELRVKPDISRLDLAMIDRWNGIVEPREVELSEELRDDLHDCTPQALLRDLHRPELDFEKQFEVQDPMADYHRDISSIVAEAMATSTKLPAREDSPFQEARALLLELRAERRQPWVDIKMPLRRVTE